MQIWAHRGASAQAPENTRIAFELALALPVEGIELDVHLSADGVPVICHDETIDRTSDGTGLIAEKTYEELLTCDFSCVDDKDFSRVGTCRIMTLPEVLTLAAPSALRVNIELKTDKLMSSAVGQINEYLNYYATEVNDEFDNPPIGIILCTDKRNVDAHYALGGLENRVFASTYTTVMPDEDELAEQVRMAIEANERKALMSGEEDA